MRYDRASTMDTDSDKKRGEKRGILSTDRARTLREDADADATDDED